MPTPAFVTAAPLLHRGAACSRARAAPPTAKVGGPRQGAQTRQCVVTRERLPRSLMFRVVRQGGAAGKGKGKEKEKGKKNGEGGSNKTDGSGGTADGKRLTARERRHKQRAASSGRHAGAVVALDGEGRSAYVRKDEAYVLAATQKKRLSKALRCAVPRAVEQELLARARAWQLVPTWRRGLTYAECFGADGAGAAVDEVQDGDGGSAAYLQDTLYDDVDV